MRLALAGGVLGTGAYQFTEKNRLQIRRETLSLPKWKADGFKVAFLSDLHVNSKPEIEPALEAMRAAVAEKPDVILLGGDYMNWGSSLPHVESWLRQLETRAIPTYAILGNHDFWSGDVGNLIARLGNSKLKLLRNEIAHVEDVAIYGIDDGIQGKDRHDRLREHQDSGSVIGLFHEPDFVTRVDPRLSVMLAGHSHGGQVCLPMGKPMSLPRGARKYYDGFYPDAKVPLFVSRGVGMTGPRVRLFCRPDVSILTLQRA